MKAGAEVRLVLGEGAHALQTVPKGGQRRPKRRAVRVVLARGQAGLAPATLTCCRCEGEARVGCLAC